MRYSALTWAEQKEWMDKGVALCMSCIRLIREGLSDEEIADQLGYDLPDMQKIISESRALLASLSR